MAGTRILIDRLPDPKGNFQMTNSAPITERRYVVPLVLVTSLFFVWAIGVNLNDILIQHLKKAFGLTDFKSSLIQSAFFGGYFLAALPAGWLMQRIGYKRGILAGLMVCATGTILFIPAASVRVYGFFLFALFIMACGQSFLEVAANPYVTMLGPAESSERRLNLAQSFNAMGAVLIALLGSRFILSGIEHTPAELAAMSPAQLLSYRMSEANMVKAPYLVITGVFVFIAILIALTKLPEIQEASPTNSSEPGTKLRGTLAFPHLIKGVIAQFFYVGAQVGVASFIIRFSEFSLPGTFEKTAAHYLQFHLAGFMIGRFAGSAIMQKISPPRLLSIFAGGSLLCLITVLLRSGQITVWAIVLIGFFHSIMFPTIFALSLKNLGPYTKLGSSLLVMSIIGGAVCPAIMGRISDVWNIQLAFVVPLVCHAYVFYFAMRGYRPSLVPAVAARPISERDLA
jgi:FHS family L-fucose permease-like MFS transporter